MLVALVGFLCLARANAGVPVDTLRLALTPHLNGIIENQEWEPFGEHTFFEWEPGKVYWAAHAALGQDVVFSVDGNGDGWLKGNDNFEIRASWTGSEVKASVRRLGNQKIDGPAWMDPGLILDQTVGKVSTGGWTLEGSFTFTDQRLAPREGKVMGIRIDLIPTTAEIGPAYVPRPVDLIQFRYDKSLDLFPGLTWSPKSLSRAVAHDDTLKTRFEFSYNGPTPNIKTVSFDGEGFAKDVLLNQTFNFPDFNKRKSAYLDYQTKISHNASYGYHILRATLTGSDGQISVLRTSVRIAELVDISTNLPQVMEVPSDATIVRAKVFLHSQAIGRITGHCDVKIPSEWTINRGQSQAFLIYHSKGDAVIPLELIVPRGTTGTFPIDVDVTVGEEKFHHTAYMVLE